LRLRVFDPFEPTLCFGVGGAAGPSSLSPGFGGLPVAAKREERDPEKAAQLTLQAKRRQPEMLGVLQ
jgi:hypothetical protein